MTRFHTIIAAALVGLFLAACNPYDECMGLRPVIEQRCASGDAEMCIQLQKCPAR